MLSFVETGVEIEQVLLFRYEKYHVGRSRWPCDLRPKSAAARLLGSGLESR